MSEVMGFIENEMKDGDEEEVWCMDPNIGDDISLCINALV